MSGEILDGSSDSTDPPSLAELAVQPQALKPLYVHRKSPVVLLAEPKSEAHGFGRQTPQSRRGTPRLSARSYHSNLYTLATCRTKEMFVDVKKSETNSLPANPRSNPMAVHLARRQAQAARIMAGEEAENAQLFRPCRIDLKHKSPRRLRQIFRRRSSQSPWTSQYIGEIYYPVEVSQEFSRWRTTTPKGAAADRIPLPLVSMDSPAGSRAQSCCVKYLWPFKRIDQSQLPNSGSRDAPTSVATTGRSQRSKNIGFTDNELAWAMSRTCRVRKPWATIVEKERASRGELRYAGIKLLAGLLEARAGWPASANNRGDLSAAVRSLCYEDESLRLDFIKRRKLETYAPDWVLQLMMPLIAPLNPRRGYALLSQSIEKAQAHFGTLSESALLEVQNNIGHLNLNQLTHLRLALPEVSPEGSLRKVRIRDLISACEHYIGQRFWQFLSERVRPSSAIYEVLLEKANNALMTHAILPSHKLTTTTKTRTVISDWSSTVSSTPCTPSDRQTSLDSVMSLVDGHPFEQLSNVSEEGPLSLGLAQGKLQGLVELPKLKINVKQNLGLAFLEVLGVLALSENTRTELLEEPVTILSDVQSWWLLFTDDLTKTTAHRGKKSEQATTEPGSMIPPDVIGENFPMCFMRLPALELRFARPEEVDIFTINEIVKPEMMGGKSVWAIRVIPAEVEDLMSFAPVDPSAHLGGLCLSEAFKKRREHAEAHAMTNMDLQPSLKPRQRLRSVSRTRTRVESPLKTPNTMMSTRPPSTKMMRRAPTTMHDWLTQGQPWRK